MRAWLMDSYDGVDKLRLGEVPDPQPGAGQVLLKVRLAAINPADAYLAKGMYPAKPALPHILGRDGLGEVLAVGDGADQGRLGGSFALPNAGDAGVPIRTGQTLGILRGSTGVDAWGTLAEKVVVPASNVVPVPSGWSLEELAGAPLVFLTAWQALTQWSEPPAPPPPKSVLLVTGASGGVGTAAVMLAKSMDLIVVALSRSAQKGEKLRELGADFVFSPEDPHLRQAVLAAVAPKKVDLVVDNVAGPLFNELVGMLGHGGRISVVGRSGGPVPEFNTATLFFRRNRIGGVSVGDYTPQAAQATWRQIVERLNALGKRPIVDSVFAFDDVKAAFARLAGGPMGKVLVRVAE
jgi:NADPH2:quinone reductase